MVGTLYAAVEKVKMGIGRLTFVDTSTSDLADVWREQHMRWFQICARHLASRADNHLPSKLCECQPHHCAPNRSVPLMSAAFMACHHRQNGAFRKIDMCLRSVALTSVAPEDIVQCEDARNGISATFAIGWYLQDRNVRHWCRGRSSLRAENWSDAFQMLSSDRVGEKVGRTLLAIRVRDLDISAFCHFLHKEEPEFDVFQF